MYCHSITECWHRSFILYAVLWGWKFFCCLMFAPNLIWCWLRELSGLTTDYRVINITPESSRNINNETQTSLSTGSWKEGRNERILLIMIEINIFRILPKMVVNQIRIMIKHAALQEDDLHQIGEIFLNIICLISGIRHWTRYSLFLMANHKCLKFFLVVSTSIYFRLQVIFEFGYCIWSTFLRSGCSFWFISV